MPSPRRSSSTASALITNAPDLTQAEAVARYKALADIERGFRVLKSDIEIAPVHHRLPDRIRAHALICLLALVLYRVMRLRLREMLGELVAGDCSFPQFLGMLRLIEADLAAAGIACLSLIGQTTNRAEARFAAKRKSVTISEQIVAR